MTRYVNDVFFFSLQIRQEKPYYIADPEVDSLVSGGFHSFLFFFLVHVVAIGYWNRNCSLLCVPTTH